MASRQVYTEYITSGIFEYEILETKDLSNYIIQLFKTKPKPGACFYAVKTEKPGESIIFSTQTKQWFWLYSRPNQKQVRCTEKRMTTQDVNQLKLLHPVRKETLKLYRL